MATKKRKFDGVVSALGTLLDLMVTTLFTKLKKQGLSLAEAIVRLASDEKAQDEIVAILAGLVRPPSVDQRIQWWVEFWASYGFVINPTTLTIPVVPAGFGPIRLIVIPQGLTIQRAWEIAKSLFPCYNYIRGNLDEAIPTNDRVAYKGYVVAFRDRPEADEEFKNISANDLKARNHKGITALEAIVDEIGFYKKTDGHRDIQNVTLCTGSRYSDGCVPGSYWNVDEFQLYWYSADYRYDNLRSRQAVS